MDTKKILLYFSILIIIASIAVDIFIIFTFPIAGNESCFATRAISVINGGVPYTINNYFNHPPFGIYFLSFISLFVELNPVTLHLAGFFWEILILILIFFISRKYFGVKKAVIASAIYITVSTSFFGVIYSSEYPSVFFGLLGIFFYFLFFEKNKKYNLFLSGLIIGISMWFKQPGFFFLLAIIIHQFYLFFKKKQSFKSAFINASIVVLGSLAISIPLLIYFILKTGNGFFYGVIIFNLFFQTRHSRLIMMGKCLRILLEYFGFLFIIILASPKKEEPENDQKIISFSWIYIIIIIIFYFLNRELFPLHMINLLVILAFFSIFCIRKYEGNSLKLIRILIVISLLTIFMINLEFVVRDYQRGEKIKQEQIKNYLLSEIPKNSSVYSTHDLYSLLSGFKNTYHDTTIQPGTASMSDFSDFCSYIDGMDYLIFTGNQEKYLGDKNIECAYSKFDIIKKFDDIDPSGQGWVEVLKKKKS